MNKKWILIIALIMIIAIMFMKKEVDSSLQISNTGGTYPWYLNSNGAVLVSQIFSVSSPFDLTSVKLNLGKYGSPGSFYIEIRSITTEEKPSATVLSQAAVSQDILSSTPTIIEIVLPTVPLTSTTKYSLTVRAPSGDGSNYVKVFSDDTPTDEYPEKLWHGNGLINNNDLYFEIYGATTGQCVPRQCSVNSCGVSSDGCGGTISCGTCASGVCDNNICSNGVYMNEITSVDASGISALGTSLLRLFMIEDDVAPYTPFGTYYSTGFTKDQIATAKQRLVIVPYQLSNIISFNHAVLQISYKADSQSLNQKVYLPDGEFNTNHFYVSNNGETYYDSALTQPACTFTNGCAGRCSTDADTNCNGDVSDSELLAYINLWLSGSVTDTQLLQAAQEWLS